MNPIAIIHALAALLIIGSSLPLVNRKVKRNRWYGVRIPETFKSEQRWLEINEYGGRLLLRWGIGIGVMAAIGLKLPKQYWLVYSVSSLLVILGGLGIVIARILRYSARTKRH